MNGRQRAQERTDQVAREVRDFVVSNFLFGRQDGLSTADQSFLESGIIDSTGMLELITFIESTYGIAVGDRELVPENLDCLRNVSAFVVRKLDEADQTN